MLVYWGSAHSNTMHELYFLSINIVAEIKGIGCLHYADNATNLLKPHEQGLDTAGRRKYHVCNARMSQIDKSFIMVREILHIIIFLFVCVYYSSASISVFITSLLMCCEHRMV